MTRAAESEKQFIMEMGIIVWNFSPLEQGQRERQSLHCEANSLGKFCKGIEKYIKIMPAGKIYQIHTLPALFLCSFFI